MLSSLGVNASKFQIGKLSPEEAERLATSFRPVWELDDAPFAQASQASGLSSAEVDALAGGTGVAPSVRNTLQMKTEASPAAAPPIEPLSVDVDVPVDAVTVAEARPQARPRPYTPPRPPAVTVKMRPVDSGEYAPVKKSNTGLIIGVVAVVALGGAIFGIRAAMSGDKATATTTPTTTAPTHEETHIPPPPDTVVAQQAVQAPTQATSTVTKPIVDTTAAPTHAVVTNVAAPVHTAATGATHTGNHTAGGAPTHHTSIVRDNPF